MPVMNENDIPRRVRLPDALVNVVNDIVGDANLNTRAEGRRAFNARTAETISIIDKRTVRAISERTGELHALSRDLTDKQYSLLSALLSSLLSHTQTPTGLKVAVQCLSDAIPEIADSLKNQQDSILQRDYKVAAQEKPIDFHSAWQRRIGKRLTPEALTQPPAYTPVTTDHSLFRYQRVSYASQAQQDAIAGDGNKCLVELLNELVADMGNALGSPFYTLANLPNGRMKIDDYLVRDQYLYQCLKQALPNIRGKLIESKPEELKRNQLRITAINNAIGHFNTLEGCRAASDLMCEYFADYPEITSTTKIYIEGREAMLAKRWEALQLGDIYIGPLEDLTREFLPARANPFAPLGETPRRPRLPTPQDSPTDRLR